ncbi:hypothetical protein GLOTRDRAFT_96594 [Gloeophyllum trabeum ATCC 11539]|uniref:Uncharacterized protein n=1 Tax=Gloeophyllum trabeum (strain ATCC 11539 / FP-39264 / Madison 617) TaxID=670483 RepID=S7PUI7_GLOTA|nr:uncharacterized protein GLOTRDRAFT_96594 [Gloeophyllum trabeum ATCC 11539]EPQ51028.1 hypothetical protein GLOTRDRAFT_96594 [Gloeophyllum trabeum ATCC 11539]
MSDWQGGWDSQKDHAPSTHQQSHEQGNYHPSDPLNPSTYPQQSRADWSQVPETAHGYRGEYPAADYQAYGPTGANISPRRRHSLPPGPDYNHLRLPAPNFYPQPHPLGLPNAAISQQPYHARSMHQPPYGSELTSNENVAVTLPYQGQSAHHPPYAPVAGDTRNDKPPSPDTESEKSVKGKQAKRRPKKGDADNKAEEKEPNHKPKTKKARGQGSKSGVNRRAPGASDEDIAGLKQDEAASVTETTESQWTDEEDLAVVKYICEPKWVNFKATQAMHSLRYCRCCGPGHARC